MQARWRALPTGCRLMLVVWLCLWALIQVMVHRPGIVGDMWDVYAAWLSLQQQVGSADVLRELLRKFAQVHILAVPKLWFWANFAWFEGSGALLRITSFAVCVINAGLLWRLLSPADKPASPLLLFACFALFFNGFQTLALDWDFLLQHYFAILFTLLAFQLLSSLQEINPLRLLLACVCLALAGFSCGSGLASVLAVGFMFCTQPVPPAWRTAYLVFAAVALWVLWPDAQLVQDSSGQWVSLEVYVQSQGMTLQTFFWNAPLLLLQYLAYPASAWGFMPWVGLILLLMGIEAFVRCLFTARASLRDYLFCYFLLVACSIVYGRYRLFALDADLSRYYIYIAPLWVLAVARVVACDCRYRRTMVILFCTAVVFSSAAAVIVANDHAIKMDLARVVLRSGNTEHFATIRLNAMRSGQVNPHVLYREALQQSRSDVYAADAEDDAVSVVRPGVCRMTVQRKKTTKGKFADYFLRADVAQDIWQGVYVSDTSGEVLYRGVVMPAATHLEKIFLQVKDVRLQDWPLLLPESTLPASARLLYLHLPANVDIATLQVWAVSASGDRCQVELVNSHASRSKQ